MIFLSGSINLLSQQELQREAELFARNGWELRDPTTHKTAITIAQEDIEAFCDYLRNRPADRKPKVWRDRDGTEHQAPTVTFYLNGSEMTGSWTRLRARLDPSSQPRQTSSSPPERAAAMAPVRRLAGPIRNATNDAPQPPRNQSEAPPAWSDEIPF